MNTVASNSVRTLRTDKGMAVETMLTDREAVEVVANLPSDFARSLVSKFRQYGSLFPNQLAWLHKLANDKIHSDFLAHERREMPKANPEAEAIAEFLNKGNAKGTATVTFLVNGKVIEIKAAGKTSKHFGSYWVTDGKEYGANTLYAKITKDGEIERRKMIPEVIEILREMEANPGEFCIKYGKKTGMCCFCHATLTDHDSIGYGYGPVCGPRYGLPYKKKKMVCVAG